MLALLPLADEGCGEMNDAGQVSAAGLGVENDDGLKIDVNHHQLQVPYMVWVVEFISDVILSVILILVSPQGIIISKLQIRSRGGSNELLWKGQLKM